MKTNDRMATVKARLARMDALDSALRAKCAAILAAKRFRGKDAARLLTLRVALGRLAALHPLHRIRNLPG